MPLEQAIYVSELVPDWPTGNDPESQGDDHFRMMKQVLKNTLPNASGPINGTPDQFNNLTAGVSWMAQDAENADRVAHWFAGNPSDPSQYAPFEFANVTAAQYNANAALGVNWAVIQNLIYPVHSVLISTNSANPATYLGFGTWTARVGYLAGVGSIADGAGLSASIAAGANAGAWRVQNSMIAAATLNLAGGEAESGGAHTHGVGVQASDQEGYTSAQGSSSASDGDIYTSSSGAHTHPVKGQVTIGSGAANTGAIFSPPRYAFYVWERTA